jgi:thiol-disulfide isomerase/thioredoxin
LKIFSKIRKTFNFIREVKKNGSVLDIHIIKIIYIMIRVFAIIAFSCFMNETIQAQQYRYDFELKNCKVSKAIFGYHRGEATYSIDSTLVDTVRGTFSFSGSKKLNEGEYFVYLPGLGALDFIINKENKFKIKGNALMLQDSMISEGSAENKVYFEYKNFVNAQNVKIRNVNSTMDLLRRATKDPEVIKEQEAVIKNLYSGISSQAKEIIKANPDFLFSKMLSTTLMPEPPAEFELYINQKNRYIKTHYWDGVDFTDERLLNTTAYSSALGRFLERGVESDLDSIKAATSRVIQRSSVNKAINQFTIQFYSQKFDNPKLPWMDNILVHLFDRHYKSATAVGIDTATFLRMEYKANLYRPNLIGALAPNLILYDTLGKASQLSSIQSEFILLYFFSPLCAHCQKATPVFVELAKKYPSTKLKIIAITNDGEMAYWTNFVKTQQYPFACFHDKEKPSKSETLYATSELPNVYLLDKNKKILAKKIPLENLEGLFRNFATVKE